MDYIALNFFPVMEKESQFISALIVFGVAFFMRPVGGFVLGLVSDKFGRRVGLLYSMILMLFPSFLIGCIPTYNQIGYTATTLLICCRLLQGFAGTCNSLRRLLLSCCIKC
jgi:MHS family proline/betaine transporter-like MFS transporter